MKTWTCQRVAAGSKCGHRNPSRKQKCLACGKTRPARRRAAHLKALDASYEDFVTLNGGNFCAICGRKPTARRRLDRDHDHKSGLARGLLCARCNRALPSWVTHTWLLSAAAYLSRDLPVVSSSDLRDNVVSVPEVPQEEKVK